MLTYILRFCTQLRITLGKLLDILTSMGCFHRMHSYRNHFTTLDLSFLRRLLVPQGDDWKPMIMKMIMS